MPPVGPPADPVPAAALGDIRTVREAQRTAPKFVDATAGSRTCARRWMRRIGSAPDRVLGATSHALEGAAMPATIAHFTSDTLPRVVEGLAGSLTVDMVLPFRVDVPDPGLGVRSWRLAVDVESRSWTARTRTRRLPVGLAAALRDRMQHQGRFAFDHLPYYAAL